MTAEAPLPSVGKWEAKALLALADGSRPDGEMCFPFKTIAGHGDGLPLEKVRRAVRGLARKGLAEYHKALSDDDGRFVGAGYCITHLGLKVAEELEPDHDQRSS